jgi:hypothetical protein
MRRAAGRALMRLGHALRLFSYAPFLGGAWLEIVGARLLGHGTFGAEAGVAMLWRELRGRPRDGAPR